MNGPFFFFFSFLSQRSINRSPQLKHFGLTFIFDEILKRGGDGDGRIDIFKQPLCAPPTVADGRRDRFTFLLIVLKLLTVGKLSPWRQTWTCLLPG